MSSPLRSAVPSSCTAFTSAAVGLAHVGSWLHSLTCPPPGREALAASGPGFEQMKVVLSWYFLRKLPIFEWCCVHRKAAKTASLPNSDSRVPWHTCSSSVTLLPPCRLQVSHFSCALFLPWDPIQGRMLCYCHVSLVPRDVMVSQVPIFRGLDSLQGTAQALSAVPSSGTCLMCALGVTLRWWLLGASTQK